MRLEFSPESEHDLEEIGDFIAQDNPRRTLSFVRALRTSCRSLVALPDSGAPRFELREGLRMRAHGRYLIFCTVDEKMLRIERVIHSARDVPSLLRDAR